MTTSQPIQSASVFPRDDEQCSADLERIALTASRDVVLQTGFACLQAPQHASYVTMLRAGWEPIDPLLESYLRFLLAPHHPEAGYALALHIEDQYPAMALLALRLAAELHAPMAALRFARLVRTRPVMLSEAWHTAADQLDTLSARHGGKFRPHDNAVRHLAELACAELQLHHPGEDVDYWQDIVYERLEEAREEGYLDAAWLMRYPALLPAASPEDIDETIATAESMFPTSEAQAQVADRESAPQAAGAVDASADTQDPDPVDPPFASWASPPAASGHTPQGPRHALILTLTPPRGAREIDELNLRPFEQLKREGAPLLPVSELDRLVATLSGEFPWMNRVIEAVGRQLAAQRMGDGVFRLRPMLLHGAPGSGKTRFAQRLAELAQIPFLALAVGGAADNRALRGTARGWGTAAPSLLLTFLAQAKVANPIILLDELDKDSDNRHNGRVSDTLHQLLERENATRWYDEYCLGTCDLSPLNWIATANQIDGIDKSLRSRLHCIPVPLPERGHYPAIIDTARRAYAARIGLPADALPTFDADIQRMLARDFQNPRQAVQTTERVLEILLNERRRLLH